MSKDINIWQGPKYVFEFCETLNFKVDIMFEFPAMSPLILLPKYHHCKNTKNQNLFLAPAMVKPPRQLKFSGCWKMAKNHHWHLNPSSVLIFFFFNFPNSLRRSVMIPVVYNSSSDIPLTWLIILIQSDFKFFEKYLSLQVKNVTLLRNSLQWQ